MATPLVHQGKIILPVEWSIEPQRNVMETGSFKIVTTKGIQPFKRKVTLTWNVTLAELQDVLAQVEANGGTVILTYSDYVRGTVKVRPEMWSYTETAEPTRPSITVTFEVL